MHLITDDISLSQRLWNWIFQLYFLIVFSDSTSQLYSLLIVWHKLYVYGPIWPNVILFLEVFLSKSWVERLDSTGKKLEWTRSWKPREQLFALWWSLSTIHFIETILGKCLCSVLDHWYLFDIFSFLICLNVVQIGNSLSKTQSHSLPWSTTQRSITNTR